MKRILVFSDTHRTIDLCIKAIENIPADMILHAGDHVQDALDLASIFPDKKICYVRGNSGTDSYTSASLSEVTELDGIRIFITHGHMYNVKCDSEYKTLADAAKKEGCDIAVFGHTHIAFEGNVNGVMLLNPGSARFSYGVIEIENGKAKTCVIGSSLL